MATAPALKLALFQGIATNQNVKVNLSKIREQTFKAKEAGAKIIIFPELFLTGYLLKAEDMQAAAEEYNGESFQELAKLAIQSRVAILYGYPEKVKTHEGFIYFNSAQLIDKEGQSLVNHRKIHLWIESDGHAHEKVFTPADKFSEIIEYCGFKIGILICYDVEFPEAVRTHVLRGANLILVPTASDKKYTKELVEFVVPTRAYENRVHVVYVNNAGYTFGGRSICCNENGDIIASAGEEKEELLLVRITAGGIQSSQIRDRRPELYEK